LQQRLLKREASSAGRGRQTKGLVAVLAFPKGKPSWFFAKKIVKWVSHARAQYAMTVTSN
jgi:hypothetical protein